MAIIIIEHELLETTAMLGEYLSASGYEMRTIRLHQGDLLVTDADDIDGLVIMGGTMNVDEQDRFPFLTGEMELIRQLNGRGIPIVGICLGAQLIAAGLGGEVGPMNRPEIGWFDLTLARGGIVDPVFKGLPRVMIQMHTHGYHVIDLPEGGRHLASSAMCRNQAFRVGDTTYGFQFHFEWTRQDITAIVAFMTNWMHRHGYDDVRLLSDIDVYYEFYRRQGDYLSRNIVELLFPNVRQYRKPGGEVANYNYI